MRKLTDGAVRAKEILERDNAPVPAECERMIAQDLAALLSGYFELEGDVELKIERKDALEITVRARAVRSKSFRVMK